MIEIRNFSDLEVETERLNKAVRLVLNGEGVGEKTEVSVALVGKERMRKLNADYKGRDEGTDVLSFDLGHEGLPLDFAAQIVICPQVVKQRARGAEWEDEVVRAVIHGLLHLLGYAHEGEEEKRMRQKEEEYLGKII